MQANGIFIYIGLVLSVLGFVENVGSSKVTVTRARQPRHDIRLHRLLEKRLIWAGEPVVRPVTRNNQTAPTAVKVYVSLREILELDEGTKTGALEALVWLNHRWVDPNLKWKPSAFGGRKMIRLPFEHLWKPDIKLYDSHKPEIEVDKSTWAVVTSDGSVAWDPPAKLQSTCTPVITARQQLRSWNCTWVFGSWTHSAHQLTLVDVTGSEGLDTSNYKSWEWTVGNVTSSKRRFKYDCCPEPYEDLKLSFLLSRKN